MANDYVNAPIDPTSCSTCPCGSHSPVLCPCHRVYAQFSWCIGSRNGTRNQVHTASFSLTTAGILLAQAARGLDSGSVLTLIQDCL